MMMRQKNKGFSLIELMVSLTISITFVAAAASLLARNKTDYIPLRDSARMNEGAMASFDLINRELEQAGFFGENEAFQSTDYAAGGVAAANRFVNHMYNAHIAVPANYNYLYGLKRTRAGNRPLSTAVEGFDGDTPNAGFYPSGVTVFDDGTLISGEVLLGTDAITIRGASGGLVNINANDFSGALIGNRGPGVLISQDSAVGANTLQLQSVTGLPQQGYYVVYDGQNSELFKGALNGNSVVMQDDAPANNMPGNAFVNPFASLIDATTTSENGQAFVVSALFTRYYIGNYINPDGDLVPSLYREFYDENSNTVVRNSPDGSGGLNSQVLIEGVENMQITYAEDLGANGSVDVYAAANDVQNWANIKAVKIALLVRSETQSAVDATTGSRDYQVNDELINPGTTDRFVRKVYTTQIALDNGV